PPRPLKDFNPAVPDGLQQIVNWMLAKDPAQRYPTPDRAAAALRVFLAAGAEPAPTAEADPHMRKYLTWLEVDDRDAARAPPKPSEQRLFSLPLTRRDLVMFGLGAGTVAVGAGIGLVAAWLAGAFKKKEPPPDNED